MLANRQTDVPAHGAKRMGGVRLISGTYVVIVAIDVTQREVPNKDCWLHHDERPCVRLNWPGQATAIPPWFLIPDRSALAKRTR